MLNKGLIIVIFLFASGNILSKDFRCTLAHMSSKKSNIRILSELRLDLSEVFDHQEAQVYYDDLIYRLEMTLLEEWAVRVRVILPNEKFFSLDLEPKTLRALDQFGRIDAQLYETPISDNKTDYGKTLYNMLLHCRVK